MRDGFTDRGPTIIKEPQICCESSCTKPLRVKKKIVSLALH